MAGGFGSLDFGLARALGTFGRGASFLACWSWRSLIITAAHSDMQPSTLLFMRLFYYQAQTSPISDTILQPGRG